MTPNDTNAPHNCYAVIMAGGAGTRFWPIGRRSKPKQLLYIEEGQTLIQATLDRLPEAIDREHTIVVTGADQKAELERQIDLPPENVIGEPEGRDTAACIALAAAIIDKREPDAVMAVMAADHLIHPKEAFRATLMRAVAIAEAEDALVTIGIKPDHPATGYGYIEIGKEREPDVFDVANFVEKPDVATASRYLANARHLWNSGLFAWKVSLIRAEIAKSLPRLATLMAQVEKSLGRADFADTLAKVYAQLPKVSIDFGVMEESHRVIVVRADFEWDDVGSLTALERHNERDERENTVLGDCVVIDSSRNIVDNREEAGLVALLGVDDLVVVRRGDAVLVAKKSEAERIKEIVAHLEKHGRDTLL